MVLLFEIFNWVFGFVFSLGAKMSIFYKKFADMHRFVMTTESSIEGKVARLVMSFRDGNPRLTVYTGAAGKDGVIAFPSDYPTFASALVNLKQIADGENGKYISIGSLTNTYVDNKMTDEKKMVSSLVIGKSKDGIVYMGVLAEGKPKLIFEFKPSPYHIFKDNTGNNLALSEVSKTIAKGVADLLLSSMAIVMVESSKEYYQETGKSVPIQQTNGNQTSASNVKANDPVAQFEDITY